LKAVELYQKISWSWRYPTRGQDVINLIVK